MKSPAFSWLLPALVVLSVSTVSAEEPAPRRRPDRFAIIFNMGYADDAVPADPAEFEKLIRSIKKAHFNVVLCKYDPHRQEVCKKHDVQMFVDLLVGEHHVYKNSDAARRLCESLKDEKAVYGYHIWSDNIGKTYDGRTRDVQNVQSWDPNHPVYVGTYRMAGVGRVKAMDLFGYYDFHWTRGGHWNHLNAAWALAKERNVGFLRYDAAAVGVVGKGNPNRVGYTFGTSIPFGLRGFMFHYAGGQIDKKTLELDDLGRDLAIVNERFAVVGPEVIKVGIPSRVVSTPITKTAKNDPVVGQPAVPAGLTAFAGDSWFQIKKGEVLIGVSTEDAKRDVLIFASHNPYETQGVTLAFSTDIKSVEMFDAIRKEWRTLAVKNREVMFTVHDYGVDLVRVQR